MPVALLNYRTNNGSLQTFTVDNENQLTSAPDGNCTYDANGNLLSAKSAAQKFAYDAENQLTEVSNYQFEAVSTKTVFAYDGMNRLRLRREYEWFESPPDFTEDPGGGDQWLHVGETRYLYDGWRVIQERDSNNVPTVSYTRGTDLSGSLEGAGGIGGLLARSHGYSTVNGNWSTHNFYHADGNGNITYLVNSSQSLAASYRYDPYGNTISSSGSLAGANVYRFSGKEIHGNTGLYYYLYRWYAPEMQRWVNRDPWGEAGLGWRWFESPVVSGDGPNSYEFVSNNPIDAIDPLGLFKLCTPYVKVPCGPNKGMKCRLCIGTEFPGDTRPPDAPPPRKRPRHRSPKDGGSGAGGIQAPSEFAVWVDCKF